MKLLEGLLILSLSLHYSLSGEVKLKSVNGQWIIPAMTDNLNIPHHKTIIIFDRISIDYLRRSEKKMSHHFE